MKAFNQKLAIAVTGLLLTAGPALAQAGGDRGGAGGGDRGGASGSTTSAGGGMNASGGGGNIAGGGGGSTSSGGGGDVSSPSASSFSSPSMSLSDRGFRSIAPEHRLSYSATSGQRSHTASSGDQATARPSSDAPSRSGGGNSGSGERATPRSESGGSGERAVARGTGASAARENAGTSRRANEGNANNANGANEVPNWSRPRGDRPATDVAVTRTGPQPPRDSGDRNRGYGYYYDPYYYGGYGYGFGYGGGYYSCAYCGYPFYSPYGFGYGIPYGYFDPYYADPYDYGGGYGAYSSRVYGGQDQGSLKLKVKPRNAKVYVDGYYVGIVDEFDGSFQKLTLNGGRHKVEVRAEGYETAEFDVLITPNQTVTFAGDMKKVQ